VRHELRQVGKQLVVALRHRPGMKAGAGDGLPDGEDLAPLLHQRRGVDDAVDGVVEPAIRQVLVDLRVGGVLHDLAELAAALLQHGRELGQPREEDAARLHAHREPIQVGDFLDPLVVRALDVVVRGTRDRRCEVEDLQALLTDDRARDGGVVLAGRNRRQQAGPGQDFLADLELGVLLQLGDDVVVEALRLAAFDELERRVIVFGGDGHVAALLDLFQRSGGACERDQQYR
jgi:hypothetical protein